MPSVHTCGSRIVYAVVLYLLHEHTLRGPFALGEAYRGEELPLIDRSQAIRFDHRDAEYAVQDRDHTVDRRGVALLGADALTSGNDILDKARSTTTFWQPAPRRRTDATGRLEPGYVERGGSAAPSSTCRATLYLPPDGSALSEADVLERALDPRSRSASLTSRRSHQ